MTVGLTSVVIRILFPTMASHILWWEVKFVQFDPYGFNPRQENATPFRQRSTILVRKDPDREITALALRFGPRMSPLQSMQECQTSWGLHHCLELCEFFILEELQLWYTHFAFSLSLREILGNLKCFLDRQQKTIDRRGFIHCRVLSATTRHTLATRDLYFCPLNVDPQ